MERAPGPHRLAVAISREVPAGRVAGASATAIGLYAWHNVVCAVDGVDGLEKIAEALPDIVFLDITMPRMDGYEVCKQIRSNPVAKDLPVVMISGKDGFFDKVRGRMAGSTGYITKPFGPETLMRALETHFVSEDTAPEQ